jgi:hypothetical protein
MLQSTHGTLGTKSTGSSLLHAIRAVCHQKTSWRRAFIQMVQEEDAGKHGSAVKHQDAV